MNRIINANSMDYLESGKQDGKVHLVVTSPPYDDIRCYKGYEFDHGRMLAGIHRVLVDGGVCCWVVGDRIRDGDRTLTSFKQALLAQELGFKVNDVIIYQKTSTPFFRSNAYTQAHELMFVLVKGKGPRVFNPLMKKAAGPLSGYAHSSKKPDNSVTKVRVRGAADREVKRTNVWKYTTGGVKDSSGHPAVFPVALAEDCVRSWSVKGDVVLDPMNGSGTTCLAAKGLGRSYIGIDISKEYCELARARLRKAVPLLAA